jgi:hypothetical protein
VEVLHGRVDHGVGFAGPQHCRWAYCRRSLSTPLVDKRHFCPEIRDGATRAFGAWFFFWQYFAQKAIQFFLGNK